MIPSPVHLGAIAHVNRPVHRIEPSLLSGAEEQWWLDLTWELRRRMLIALGLPRHLVVRPYAPVLGGGKWARCRCAPRPTGPDPLHDLRCPERRF